MLSPRADSGRVLCRVQVDGDNINICCNCMRLGYNFIFIINSFKVGSLYLYLAAPASQIRTIQSHNKHVNNDKRSDVSDSLEELFFLFLLED